MPAANNPYKAYLVAFSRARSGAQFGAEDFKLETGSAPERFLSPEDLVGFALGVDDGKNPTAALQTKASVDAAVKKMLA